MILLQTGLFKFYSQNGINEYNCIIMLEAMPTLMNKIEITIKNGNRYFYTTSSFNVKNPLGVTRATLTEYSLYKMEDAENLVAKLYKTDDGNWYDMSPNNPISSITSTFIKMAIDESERR